MTSAALGLSSWRWNNNLKSILLLAAFPALLLAIVAGIFCVAGYVNLGTRGFVDRSFLAEISGILPTIQAYGAMTPVDLATTAVGDLWPVVFGVALIWIAVGYLFNAYMIDVATGARPTSRAENPKLYNLLENLCISRGMRMPRLSIVDSQELNAYASGIDERSFGITVTQGLLDRLDDAELEAVLAHELSHIINRDVRLLIVSIVFTGMLSFIAQMLWRSLRYASYGKEQSRRRNNGAAALMLIAAIMIAIGYVFAIFLRFALSRRREYLADAGAVSLTKNPDAMMSALEKISKNPNVPNVPPEVQQLFIENPPSMFGLFDTHPRIEDRIAVLRALSGRPPKGRSTIPSVEVSDDI